MRYLLIATILLFFNFGCASICPQSKQAVLQDQQDFSLAFAKFQDSHRIDGFQKLISDYPNSIWADRAKTIILYSQELDQRKSQYLELQKQSNENRTKAEKAEQLEIENQELMLTIEKLKGSLIQSEKYPK